MFLFINDYVGGYPGRLSELKEIQETYCKLKFELRAKA